MNDLAVNAFAPFLHKAQLANAVTSFATCLGGIMPLLFTLLTKRQPARWVFAYLCVFITGIPTVWMHAYEGNRLASFFDVGTNILLAWALQIAVSGDFMTSIRRKTLLAISTLINIGVWTYLAFEVTFPKKLPFLSLGASAHFYFGEVALILNAFVVVGLFVLYHHRIPRNARGLFYLIVGMFLCGLVLATGDNDYVTWRIVAWHSVWHLVGAFGFVTLWLFNYVRFNESDAVSTR